MDNYEYCVQFALDELKARPSTRVLDYGCGSGRLVRALLERGLAAFGCDIFYGAASPYERLPPELRGSIIRRMDCHTIPFEDASFDLILDNQVLEHVIDLGLALREMHRVLKRGGKVLSLYPDKGVWLESHSRIPFLHWFPKESAVREPYAAILRALGVGSARKGLSSREWSRVTCGWLDRWTHYRAQSQIASEFERHFERCTHLEVEWLDARLSGSPLAPARFLLPRFARRGVARKLGGVVTKCEKSAA